MSFETIRIHHDIPMIDGFLQIPPNLEKDKNAVSIDDVDNPTESPDVEVGYGTVIQLSGSGRQRGSRYGGQEIFRPEGVPQG